MKKYTDLIISLLNLTAFLLLMKDNANLRRRLAEQTDKHWSANMQIAHYSDELRKHEAVKAIECERRNKHCFGCPFDGVVCNEQH